jgi:peptide/nickel transport system substrate-binding protein
MTEPFGARLNGAYTDYLAGRIDRRALLRQARALGLTGAALAMFSQAIPAAAQEASPAASPAADLSYTSITSAEAAEQLLADFPVTEADVTGGTLILGSNTGMSTTNIVLAADTPSIPILGLVNEALVGVNPKNAQYVPKLADFWEVAADGMTYIFHLRQDVTWHDGTPFTADDVIFSFDALASPDTGSVYTGSFNGTVASYRKIDDFTVEMVGVAVMAPVVFLSGSYAQLMAKHVWEAVPFAEWKDDPSSTGLDGSRIIGTGPFKWNALDTSTGTVTLDRYEGYYGKVPYVDQVLMTVWPDLTSAVEALRAGDIDSLVQLLPPADAAALADDRAVEVAVYDTHAFAFMAYNLDPENTTLFQDVPTRQALMYALDRQSIVDNILLGFGEVAQGTQPVLSIAYAPDQMRTNYTFDPEKAARLLVEAGWADSDGDGVLERDGQRFEFTLTYGAGDAAWDQLAAYAQEAWAQVGVAMTPDAVDFASVLLPILTGPTPSFNFEMIATTFGWDPSGDQAGMFSTDAYPSGFNFMRYSNPEADALFAQASQTVDEADRIELLIEASNIVNDDIPMQILYFLKGMTGYSARVHNFHPNSTSAYYWFLPYAWISAS